MIPTSHRDTDPFQFEIVNHTGGKTNMGSIEQVFFFLSYATLSFQRKE